MSKAARSATLAGLILLLVAGLAIGGFWVTGMQIASANRRWCATLMLLTAQPVGKPADPKANPSRVGQYELYADFVRLKQEFGCR